jgi:cell division protease FtsH
VTYEKDSRNFLTGPIAAGFQEKLYSEATARDIDDEVKEIVDDVFLRSMDLLRSRHDVLKRGAELLLEKETLNENELLALVGSVPPQPVATAAE